MKQHNYSFPKKTIRDVSVHDKRVLVRADFNVPLSERGAIESDFRITQSLPTLNYLVERNCTVFVIAHLGRPDGKVVKELSLATIVKHLQGLMPDTPIRFADSTVDDAAWRVCKNAKPGTITVLENLRFSPLEEENSADFAHQLKRITSPDYFVQDGFGVVHRAHASTEAITHLVPSLAGLLLEKEVTTLESAMKNPKHPLVAVVGGAKISDKIGFIERLLPIADTVLIGGAMANTFLKARGSPIGRSKYEEGEEKEVERIFRLAKPDQVLLPIDVATASEVSTNAKRLECLVDAVSQDDYILDLGPKTMELFDAKLAKAHTVIWNGTLGMAELPEFAKSSADLAAHVSKKHRGITSIVGGGDTADFALEWLEGNADAEFTHISTGGGASLELMSGLKLPGVEALLSH